MAMARASSVHLSLVWLHVLQQMYRMMASAGVTIPAPSRGTRVRHEHEVGRSWTEWSRPRGQRLSGQEHERARSNV